MESLPCTGPGRLEAREGEGVDIFLERHAILQAERDRDREVVDEGAQRRAFLVHVDEDLAEPAVVVFAGAQIDLVAADHGLLGVALAAVGSFSRSRSTVMRSTIFSTTRSATLRGARRHRLLDEGLDARRPRRPRRR